MYLHDCVDLRCCGWLSSITFPCRVTPEWTELAGQLADHAAGVLLTGGAMDVSGFVCEGVEASVCAREPGEAVPAYVHEDSSSEESGAGDGDYSE